MRGFKERDATDFAERAKNVVTSSAADPATTNTFQPLADAVTSSVRLALRSASCRPHDQNNSRRFVVNGARRDRTPRWRFPVA